jgi:ribose 5-phosphate isomerase A
MSRDPSAEKRLAAQAGAELVQHGMVVGLGTGSTAEFLIPALRARMDRGLRFTAFATSKRTHRLAAEAGFDIREFDGTVDIDLTIDGADEIDPAGNLIKGGGGAHLHEKIIAAASRHLAIIADSSKLVMVLGKFPLPVEVIPFGHARVQRALTALGVTPRLRLTQAGTPFITDEGNYILDCPFGSIADPAKLAEQIRAIVGVVEHGLFIGMARTLIIGECDIARIAQVAASSRPSGDAAAAWE